MWIFKVINGAKMFKFIQTYRQNKRLRELELNYKICCNDVECFKFTLKKAIRRGDDKLGDALRSAITDAVAERNKLLNKIKAIKAYLGRAKENNTVITTG